MDWVFYGQVQPLVNPRGILLNGDTILSGILVFYFYIKSLFQSMEQWKEGMDVFLKVIS